ncbi:ferredoxin--NADP(+) reductase [Buchnera aphidicola]|jgi:ferredoxin--NADP+ reductase|uniref:Flavodoxin/ferredoxin--NADP reductase n=1 Tax=Buchnera aphidicola subsp. Schizaphis graminum (strain Sg) TaxID=198804 RepID=FENR_BUCAP|nr:ferredoxin--NADP(+) reductase [Buchnera aphidicola]Q9Z615.1 RecName: Full=Flavodoxin/ferredoxin--NADP reductase; AltName: Full=Ferredoxin (flavodoxin):NADP(+) oxidoreductase; AltName: Full=Ferredoxin--NADP reductase; Short=FNR; AltName: Full=Flavodoxin--NADP reductase; Short=FLDR [Buchnera aphidicola str. Sg (Schizaphis graminum)]AAD19635.1 ferridoxin NADP+ reductase [Buchnera aphidicola]AAM68098.1 ferridoxin NADP reductase [Buchnera aphidicola str. Sg (Schizaphis graminum)]AWI49947.1 ferred
MNPWINANVLKVHKWTQNLFSLILNAEIAPFQAGQFTKLALNEENINFSNNVKKKKIQRAYSFVNAPSNKNLEIYIVRILNGKLSNLLYNLKSGDNLFIKEKSFGFFTLDEIPNCKTLWMFATGTGIGPYCSILQEYKNINRFKNIILIHAVRYQNELTYLPLMKQLYKSYNGKLKIETIVSREKNHNSLYGRIPLLLQNQILEKKIGLKINRNDSHVMLCGNPAMVKDTYLFLQKDRCMQKNLRRKHGHITMENYW